MANENRPDARRDDRGRTPNEAESATANPPLKRSANAGTTRQSTRGRRPPKMRPDAWGTNRI